MNSGLLEFNDDCKVRIDVADDNETVEKAVLIDSAGNETAIGGGGGGSSDFSTAQVTLTVNPYDGQQANNVYFPFGLKDEEEGNVIALVKKDNKYYSEGNEIEVNSLTPYTATILFIDGAFIYFQVMKREETLTVVGDAEVTTYDEIPVVKVMGNCTISVDG